MFGESAISSSESPAPSTLGVPKPGGPETVPGIPETIPGVPETVSGVPDTTRKCSPNQHIINNFLLVSTDLGKQLRNQEIYVIRINRVNIYLLVSTDLGKQLQNRSIMPLKSTK
jgi:hypothetical protein